MKKPTSEATPEAPLGLGSAAREAVPALAAEGLTKTYPGVRALSAVDLALRRGEVRALLGKNGAGKSTLVKVLSGAIRPDAGRVAIEGEVVRLTSTADARNAGIATVYQELSLVPELSVAENIMLGRWPTVGRKGIGGINRQTMRERAQEALAQLDVDLKPHRRVSALSVAERQVVEIAKALSFRPKVLILDEPTSSLPGHEVDVLLELVRRLAARGMAVVYVSHRMKEIPRVADSVTVLRDGRLVATLPVADTSTADIVKMMTGGSWERSSFAANAATDEVVLRVRHLTRPGKLHGVSFDLRRGEILGLAGLLGAGRTELLHAIFGLDPDVAGTVVVEGREQNARSPRQMIAAGVGLAPEDRKRDGLALGLSVAHNLVLSCFNRVARGPVLSATAERSLTRATVQRLAVKTPALTTPVGLLSGGNQQKVILGKWLNARSRILMLDEPTRGIDIEAKDQIYLLLRELAAEGLSVLIVSSEFEELFLVCDRLLVLNHGRVVGESAVSDTNLNDVMALAMEGAEL